LEYSGMISMKNRVGKRIFGDFLPKMTLRH
jgi:hypothetical protein